MKKQIYDFENEVTKKVEIGAFDTQNLGPELEILKKQREASRQTMQQPAPTVPQFKSQPIREEQEAIIIEDSLDDEFDIILNKTKASAIEAPRVKEEKRKINWTAIGFGVVSLLLAGSLVFVSLRYFSTVAENTKMQAAVKEADDIKRNNNSQINTLTKQKEDIDAKLKEALKEREDLQKKLITSENNLATKDKEIETTKTEAQKKIDELQKKVDELQKQIDAIKKAAGAQ